VADSYGQQSSWPSSAIASLDRLRGTAFVHIDPSFTISWCSATYERLFGFDPTGLPALSVVHPDDVEICASMLLHHQQHAGRTIPAERDSNSDSGIDWIDESETEFALAQSEIRLRHADGRWIACALAGQSFRDDPSIGQVLIRIDHLKDQSLLQRAIATIANASPLEESFDLLSKFCLNDSDIVEAPPGNTIIWWTTTGEQQVSSQLPTDLIKDLTDPSIYSPWMQSREDISLNIDFLPRPASVAAAKACGFQSVWIVPLIDDRAEPLAMVLTWSSLPAGRRLRPTMNLPVGTQLIKLALLDERRRSDLLRVARTDTLTQINNRVGFSDALQRLIALRRFPIGALFIDIDDFKTINDTYGHPVGDAVLRAIGKRLEGLAGTRYLVARLGGDEFVMVVTNHPSHSHLQVLAQHVLDVLIAPVILDDCVIDVSASIGVSAANDPAAVETLIDRADEALYTVKRTGKGTVSLHTHLTAKAHAARHFNSA
jgi:diguanylate cyclase (GGDEF)-like protein